MKESKILLNPREVHPNLVKVGVGADDLMLHDQRCSCAREEGAMWEGDPHER